MSRIADRMDIGYFPLQDHGAKGDHVPVSVRQSIAGCRVVKMTDPGNASSAGEAITEYGIDHGHGTLGDIHPWIFWQTADVEKRGMGSWAMAWAATASTGDAYYAPGVQVQPLRDALLKADARYIAKTPSWPRNFPYIPRGAMVIMMPSTDENEQHEIAMWADPRIVAPHVYGPGAAGTLVVDLEPRGHMCMGDANKPGVGGRHARIQSLVRVVAMDSGIPGITGVHNILALTYCGTGQETSAGYGSVFGYVDGSATYTPITHGEEGHLSAKKNAGKGVGMMAHAVTYGPIHIGSVTDKHRIGTDADGNPINSAHVASGAMFFRNSEEDGPLEFGETYPDPPEYPGQTRTHLAWDGAKEHDWINGTRSGMWRWWSEVPYTAGGGGPTTPSVPSVPRPPVGGPGSGGPGQPAEPSRPSRPVTPSIPATPGNPSLPPVITPSTDPRHPYWRTHPYRPLGGTITPGVTQWVGESGAASVGEYSVLHPLEEGFAGVAWRPQYWGIPGRAYLHDPGASADEWSHEHDYRPQVLVARAWGAQADGGWDYADAPWACRAKGGRAVGGVLLCPPQYRMEDYLGLGETRSVSADDAPGIYWAAAPGVAIAWGRPTTVGGGMQARSVVMAQQPANTHSDEDIYLAQLNASGSPVMIWSAKVTQSTGNGSMAIAVPLTVSGDATVSTLICDDISIGGMSGISTTKVFEDNAGSEHTVTVTGGIITGWTVD